MIPPFLVALIAKYGLSLVIKVAVGAAVVLAVGGWFAKKQYDAYQRGKEAAIEKVNKETKKVEDAWDKIDDSNPTLDAALKRLRVK